MQPLDDDDLILYVYGESPDAAAIRTREAEDPRLRARLTALRELLDTVSHYQPQEPSSDFEGRLWQHLAPVIEIPRANGPARWLAGTQRVLRWHQPAVRRTLALAAVLVLVVAAFLLGRQGRGPGSAPAPDDRITVASDRILLAAVGKHLSRTQMLFLALANADLDSKTGSDLDTLRARDLAGTASLLADNRLYRQAATDINPPQLMAVLEALERVLTELANVPADGDTSHYEALRQRIDDQDLLFKVRVLSNTIEHLAQTNPRPDVHPVGNRI